MAIVSLEIIFSALISCKKFVGQLLSDRNKIAKDFCNNKNDLKNQRYYPDWIAKYIAIKHI